MSGWIKLHRDLLDKPIWIGSTAEQKVILLTLLMMANHAEKEWEWMGKPYTAKPGQMVTSLPSIVKKCGSGISTQNVRTALKRFEKYDFLTDESTNKNRLITIVNWAIYQQEDAKLTGNLTGDQQATNRRLTANKNVKNLINMPTTTATNENPFTLFESGGFGTINSIIADKLGDLVDDFGENWVIEAMKESVYYSKRNLPYVTSILERWRSRGIDEPWKEDKHVEPKAIAAGVRSGQNSSFGRKSESEYAFLDRPGRS